MRFRNLLASGVLAFALSATIVTGPLALTGCAALGIQQPQTFNERVVAGYHTISAASDTISILMGAGKITVEDARNAHTSLRTFKEGIDVAVLIEGAGDFSTAEGRLQATLAGLNALDAYLRSQQ